MSEDQRRNAERVPLDIPIDGKIGESDVRILEISLIGGLLQHSERMSMAAVFTLNFRWSGEAISLKAKVARTEMRMVEGRAVYLSGIHFAGRVEDSPEPLHRILRSLLPESMPEVEAAAPSVFAANPFFRPDDDDEDAPSPVREEGGPEPPPLFPDKPDELSDLADDIALEFDHDLDLEVPTPFIECTLVNGGWVRQAVSDPAQPREGFTIVRPEHEHEIDELCHTYLVADPDTRRLIRVSFDLVNAKHAVAFET